MRTHPQSPYAFPRQRASEYSCHSYQLPISREPSVHPPKTNEAATEFLACSLIAMTGSRGSPRATGGTSWYERLRARGYEVFPGNPHVRSKRE